MSEPSQDRSPDQQLEEFTAHLSNCQTRLFAYAFAIVQNMADAEDVCQRSHVILWQKYDQFKQGSSFYSWAAKIAHFEALNFVRRRRRERLLFSEEAIQALTKADQAASDSYAARSTALKNCLSKLPVHHKKLIRMRYTSSQSIGKIAVSLNRTENAIRSGLSRARRALRECVEDTYGKESI